MLVKSKGLCSKHYQQKWRSENLLKYSFNNLKTNAKRRGKYFDLTFEQFSEFATSTDYIGKKGKRSESMSIDRIKNEIGYTYSNIRSIPLGENSRKGTKILVAGYNYDENKMEAKVVKPWWEILKETGSIEEACPF